MVRVGDVLSFVADRLNFSANAGLHSRGSIDSFYRHLNNGVKFLATQWPIIRSSETYTSTLDNGILNFPSGVRVMNVAGITWPVTWTVPINYVTPQQMVEIKRKINSGEIFSSNQPIYWTWYPLVSAYLELQDSDYIAADLTITVDYSYIVKVVPSGGDYGVDEIIPIPLEYENALMLFVTRAMAMKESSALYQVSNAEFQEEIINIEKFRSRKQFHQVERRQTLKF